MLKLWEMMQKSYAAKKGVYYYFLQMELHILLTD